MQRAQQYGGGNRGTRRERGREGERAKGREGDGEGGREGERKGGREREGWREEGVETERGRKRKDDYSRRSKRETNSLLRGGATHSPGVLCLVNEV